MMLIFLGPPGAGKGTQAKELAVKHGLVQLSTGDMLRAAANARTKVGLEAKSLMDKGELVSDTIVINIISERIDQPDCARGAVLDGFPRTLQQAAALDQMLDDKGKKLDAVIEFKIDMNKLIERIVGRFTCTNCGEGYHDTFKKPKNAGICDVCGGGGFSRRTDDTAETVATRMMAYYRDTSPLIGYYFAKGLLTSVDGMAPIEKVAQQISRIIRK